MLDYPLPVPRDTQYDTLGLAPEASPDEILVAVRELKTSLLKQKNALLRQIEEAEGCVPELKVARQMVEELHQANAQGKLTKAQAELARLEQQVRAKCPNRAQLRTLADQLDDQLIALNRMNMENADQRLAYDRAHPPLELMKIEPVAHEAFSRNRFPLSLLREAISEFLAEQGDDVVHPSDLTRRDFSDDFTYYQLLDGLRRAEDEDG